MQIMKQWHEKRPEFFFKSPCNQPRPKNRVDFPPVQTLPEDAPHAHIINPYLRVFHHLTNAALDYAVVARKA